MKKLLYIFTSFIISTNLFSQELITQENINQAVDAWLEDSVSTEATYGHISDWDVSSVTIMEEMFAFAESFNGDLSSWDVSSVTDMSGMFYNATSFNGDISSWNVSNVAEMDYMFEGANSFNGDISNWDVSSVSNMYALFRFATSFNADLSSWDVSSVNTMNWIFQNATSFNSDLSSWDVSNVVTMRNMFDGATSFNGDLSSWNVSNVTDMANLFQDATSFNGDISSWDVSNVNVVNGMFLNANFFNGDISSWDVLSVTDMSYMFQNATDFNGDLSNWDVSNVVTMRNMFDGATSFNGDLSSWDVSSVTNMNNMFNDASSFNGDLSSWDVSNVTDMNDMFYGATSLSEVNQCAIQTSFSTNSNWPYEWECTSVQIGDFAFGGIVFYVDETGENGLVCAPSNLNGVVEGWNDFQWMDITVSGNEFIQLNASTSNLVGTGASNSSIIISSQGIGADAASMCSLLELNGYDDWFLPSLNELWEINLNNELISNIALENGGDQFDFGFYWSSSEVNLTDAWAINFVNLDNAPQGSFELSRGKMNGYLVRPIRAFGTTLGCTDATAFNYNIEANTDDGSCIAFVNGCTDETAFNYNAEANTDDESCIAVVGGCTNPLAINFDSLAIAENFTCVFDNQDFLTGSSWEIDFWVQQQDIISDYVDGYFNFIDENQLMVTTTDDLGNFQYINALYQVIDNSIYIYPSDNEIEPDYDTNYYQGHYGVFGEDSILWNPDMNWTCSGCNGQEILDADSIMGMSLQDIASLGQGLCFFNSSAFMSFESQEDCFSFIEETVWINLDFFTGEVAVLDFNLTNNQLSLTNDDDIFNLTFTDTYVGCLDPNAVNFDEQSNQQLFDEFGNLSCIYDSCDNTPFEGCIYPDGFGPFNEYFGQVECISYGGNPCGNILGCTDPSALNYAASATEDDGSCITSIDGCTDSSAFNYNGNANSDDESCVFDCSEVEIFESFDNYNAGDYLANQSNGLWTTWSNSPGTEEDAYVTDSLSFNGSNSLVLQGGGTTDIVLPLGDYQNGIWNLSFMMYVPEGFGGYFNLLHDFDSTNGNNNWAEEIYFSQSGQGFTDITGQQFDFEHDKWFEVIFNIDIEDNIILCSIDGDNLSWEWSISSSNTDISIGAINFFANAPDGEIALYYIDELRLTNNSCSELGCTDLEADNYDELAVIDDLSCFTWEQLVNNLQNQLDNYSNEISNLENDIENLSFELNEAYSQSAACELQQENRPLYLPLGWGMFGFTCPDPMNISEAFSSINDRVIIVKDALGNTYIPEYSFDGIGVLSHSRGYQIKTTEEILDFIFCPTIIGLQESDNNIYQVGESNKGGIIFYVDETGQHGLVAANEDVFFVDSTSGNFISDYEWGCVDVNVNGADGPMIGQGYDNTIDIVNQPCATNAGGITAAQAAFDYESNGYTDWYLPSIMELLEMYSTIGFVDNVTQVNPFGFNNGYYWSSTEGDDTNSYFTDFSNGDNYGFYKGYAYSVRAIRSF